MNRDLSEVHFRLLPVCLLAKVRHCHAPMKFLLDTNVLIPAEPTSTSDRETQTPLIAAMIGEIASQGSVAYIHPASIEDLNRDKNRNRRDLRVELLSKYVRLPSPPPVTKDMESRLGSPATPRIRRLFAQSELSIGA